MKPVKFLEIKTGKWTIGSTRRLDLDQIDQTIVMSRPDVSKADTPLEGRGIVQIHFLKYIGNIVLKTYFRGGWIQQIVKDRYLNLGVCRAKQEFKMLIAAAENKIRVPEPIFYLKKGSLLYQCWLGTRQIKNSGSLAEVSRTDKRLTQAVLRDVWRQIEKMSARGIHHVDLHPGNILAGPEGRAWLIDFDKAYVSKKNRSKLLAIYVDRWNRAVQKHNLPDILLK